jgi:hypothetical protein
MKEKTANRGWYKRRFSLWNSGRGDLTFVWRRTFRPRRMAIVSARPTAYGAGFSCCVKARDHPSRLKNALPITKVSAAQTENDSTRDKGVKWGLGQGLAGLSMPRSGSFQSEHSEEEAGEDGLEADGDQGEGEDEAAEVFGVWEGAEMGLAPAVDGPGE